MDPPGEQGDLLGVVEHAKDQILFERAKRRSVVEPRCESNSL